MKYEIKIKTGYDKNIFYKENNKLDIISNSYTLSMYPVLIELRKYEKEQRGELIAEITGYYFDLDYMLNENISKFEIFDSGSGETYELYEALFDNDELLEEIETINQNIFYISDIYVSEEYRQEGYFTMIINQLDEILQYIAKLNVGVIATRIYEFETCDKIDSIEHLTKEEKETLKNKITNTLINADYKILEKDTNYLVKVLY